jgi:hypothetical protein
MWYSRRARNLSYSLAENRLREGNPPKAEVEGSARSGQSPSVFGQALSAGWQFVMPAFAGPPEVGTTNERYGFPGYVGY